MGRARAIAIPFGFCFFSSNASTPGQACSGRHAEPAENEVCLATASGMDTMITGARATLVCASRCSSAPVSRD
eukprot:COSAG06_NODE_1418_length_9522_cov_19.681312_4_plen_73_part_00